MKTAGALVALACAGLGGCVDVGMLGTGQPDPTLAKNLLVDDHVLEESPKGSGTLVDRTGQCETLDNPPTDDSTPLADPVKCYWRTKALIDYRYQVYKTNLLHAVNSGTFLGDFISLGLDTAGAITPGATAAKLFSALAGAATSTKSLVSQDILYKQTITILISEMDSDRAEESEKIEKGLTAKPSLEEVIAELEEYYETGTFQHALVTLQNKAGSPTTKTTTAPASAVQAIVSIKPARDDAPFPAGSTFEIKGTVGTHDIDATYTVPEPGQSASQVASGLAGLKDFTAGDVKAVPSGTTVKLSYTTSSLVTWAAGGTEADSIELAPQQNAPAPKEPAVKTPKKPKALTKQPAAAK
jgi:hypothetical protein